MRSGASPGGALEKVDKDEAEVLLWQKMLEPFDKHGRMDIDAMNTEIPGKESFEILGSLKNTKEISITFFHLK